MKLWMNGTMIDESEAVIPVSDHGLLYGMGLFETFRTYGGRPFLLDRHAQRLRSGCAELRIAYDPSLDEIAAATSAAMRANGLEEAYVRWSVSAGTSPLGLPAAAGYGAPNVFLMVKPLPAMPSPPKELHLLKLRRNSPEGAHRLKSFHYMNNILGRWELAERTASPLAEGLFADRDGALCEGIVSNVFWAANGELYTSSLDTGCLPGITRAAVMEQAALNGVPVVEGRFGLAALIEADEAFVTNSVQEVTPVGMVYDELGTLLRRWETAPGPLTTTLQASYRKLAE